MSSRIRCNSTWFNADNVHYVKLVAQVYWRRTPGAAAVLSQRNWPRSLLNLAHRVQRSAGWAKRHAHTFCGAWGGAATPGACGVACGEQRDVPSPYALVAPYPLGGRGAEEGQATRCRHGADERAGVRRVPPPRARQAHRSGPIARRRRRAAGTQGTASPHQAKFAQVDDSSGTPLAVLQAFA